MKRFFAITALFAAIPVSAAFEIYSDFPGGNIDIVEKGEDGAKIRQQCRNSGWWFYWNFGVRGAEGGTLTFEFADSGDVIGSRGPAEPRRGKDVEVARRAGSEAEKRLVVV